MSDATQYLHDDRPFEFRKGGVLSGLTWAYETWGDLNAERSNAILILTGLSPSAHAASSEADPSPGWWEPMIGPGDAIDTDHHFVICVNSLGSCKGSSGPASVNPETGKPWRLTFPEICIEDIAAAAQRVVGHLGIEQLCAVIGPSMGGMTALAWLQQFPHGARHLLSMSSADRAEPFSIALRSLQREMIYTDPNWNGGNYNQDSWPENGMRLARKLGMITYRSASEWRGRFGRQIQHRFPHGKFGMTFEIESYLEAAARKFIGAFDPCCYLYLSRAMDTFDATQGHPNLASAVAHVKLDSAYIMGVETDFLFPPHQQEAIADAFAANGVRTALDILPSLQGHDSFLVDYDHFSRQVGAYFQRIRTMEAISA
ncbi:MAG: homoserine O-acetyltransferase [Xanthomonadales bacterium]|nr:homoserine O-acetyltransferase [Xanthomonadales bacterium]